MRSNTKRASRGNGFLMAALAARRHPPWIKVRAPSGEGFTATRRVVRSLGLHTVCEEARCPNAAECWGQRTATFLLMGDVCTRACRFCAVRHGRPLPPDPDEPRRVAEAVRCLGLRHVVVTSVDRDDLPDGGAEHFAATARAIRATAPQCAIELLVPDFRGDQAALEAVVRSPVDVLGHNVETVPRLYQQARPGARYERSLGLLERAHKRRPGLVTKSGLMAGLGESDEELLAVFRDLRDVGCSVLTVGQYLRPTAAQLPVDRYLTPEQFARLGLQALQMGFSHVESGPLVRSSYRAWEHAAGAKNTKKFPD